jgi:hypothetical protein
MNPSTAGYHALTLADNSVDAMRRALGGANADGGALCDGW